MIRFLRAIYRAIFCMEDVMEDYQRMLWDMEDSQRRQK